MSVHEFLPLAIFVIIALIVGVPWFNSWRRLRRAEFIRTYRWPPGLLDKLSRKHPTLHRKETALVAHGLRHFFLAYLMSGGRFVSMPSQVADDLWHEFILYTREYKNFCDKAFGTFLHHTPAVALSKDDSNNDGLWRVWWHCCREESINPRNPTRLPLLFALDAKLKIPNGFVYQADGEPWKKRKDASGCSGASGCGGGGGSDGGGDGGGGCGGSGCGGS
jgi:hypothetical protein